MRSIRYGVGLMSGTSLDGIDAALVRIDGYGLGQVVELLGFHTLDFTQDMRQRILNLTDPKTSNLIELTSLNLELGYLFADAVRKVLEVTNFKESLDFVASHGQTIYHLPNPEQGHIRSTLQIGDVSPIGYEFEVPVVFNFRMMDIVAGGEGAPLVPYTEMVLYHHPEKTRLLQNIGGIGNVTILDKDASLEDVWAFDTGPGNMMMNAATEYFYQEAYDKDAQYAKQGKLIDALMDALKEDAYLKIQPPKSTGREYYTKASVDAICKQYDNANDVIHTLTVFTAYSIAQAYRDFIFNKHDVDEIIIGGGGAYNPFLIAKIKEYLSEYTVLLQEDLGYSSDAKEAIAFAILGNDTLSGYANNAPQATGAKHSVVLGQIQPNPKNIKHNRGGF